VCEGLSHEWDGPVEAVRARGLEQAFMPLLADLAEAISSGRPDARSAANALAKSFRDRNS
jgi:hypothetical protein